MADEKKKHEATVLSEDENRIEAESQPDDVLDEEIPKVDPDLALTRKLNGLATLLRKYYAKAAKGDACADPLRGQGRVLALMSMRPEATQKELQFLLDMKQQSLSELLAKLEAKGYVEREKATDDGRVTIVHLTEAGAQAAPDPDGFGQSCGAYDCFDEEEREQFEKLVEQLDASLKEKLEDVDDDDECDHEEEGEQKRHRYGQQGRGGAGRGHGKGGAGGGHGKNAVSKTSKSGLSGASTLLDIASEIAGLGTTSKSGHGRGGHGRGRGGR